MTMLFVKDFVIVLTHLSDEIRGNRFKRAIVPLKVCKRVQAKRSCELNDDSTNNSE